MLKFEVQARSGDSAARCGHFKTARGEVRTPVFMPVGTLGTVKGLTPEELRDAGAQIILGNTYHLYLRPGLDVIRHFNGLHRFMHWSGPILTDSGGLQVFSLAKLQKVTEDGAAFQSHIDGSRHMLTPEKAIEIQIALDADIIMPLDRCIGYPAERDAVRAALDMTTRWARRCQAVWQAEARPQAALFGIVQGGMYDDLRRRSAEALVALDLPGYALGGLSMISAGSPTLSPPRA